MKNGDAHQIWSLFMQPALLDVSKVLLDKMYSNGLRNLAYLANTLIVPSKSNHTIVATLFHNHMFTKRIHISYIFRNTASSKLLAGTTQLLLERLALFDQRPQYDSLVEVLRCWPAPFSPSPSSNLTLSNTAIVIFPARTVALSDVRSDCLWV